jgi:acetylornithine aminotransferase
MRAGLETLRIMEEDGLLENASRVGKHLRDALQRELAPVAGFKEIRGNGLMIGIDLDRPCGPLMGQALQAGLLLSVTADSVIRLLPALTMTAHEADEVVALLVPLVKQFLATPAKA